MYKSNINKIQIGKIKHIALIIILCLFFTLFNIKNIKGTDDEDKYLYSKCSLGECTQYWDTEPHPSDCSGCEPESYKCKVCSGGECKYKTYDSPCSDSCYDDPDCGGTECNVCVDGECRIKSLGPGCTDECSNGGNCDSPPPEEDPHEGEKKCYYNVCHGFTRECLINGDSIWIRDYKDCDDYVPNDECYVDSDCGEVCYCDKCTWGLFSGFHCVDVRYDGLDCPCTDECCSNSNCADSPDCGGSGNPDPEPDPGDSCENVTCGSCEYCSNGECENYCAGTSSSCGCTSCTNCNTRDGWYKDGGEYPCCDPNDEDGICEVCQDWEKRNYYCSSTGTYCSHSITDRRTDRSNCHSCGYCMTCSGGNCVKKPGVEGYVTDLSGNPLEGVKIKILGINKEYKTDADGYYFICEFPEGTYDIVASLKNYEEVNKNFKFDGTEIDEVNFKLLDESTECQPDCSKTSDEKPRCHPECDGINGCKFYDDQAKAKCATPLLRVVGVFENYNSTHTMICCEGEPYLKKKGKVVLPENATNAVSITRIVFWRGSFVRMVTNVWNYE
jgi:hypothetical protein